MKKEIVFVADIADDIDDVIIGTPWVNGRIGASYIVFGKSGGWATQFDLLSLNGTNGFTIIGEETQEGLGYSVSQAGDINNDGVDDVIVCCLEGNCAFEVKCLFGQTGTIFHYP